MQQTNNPFNITFGKEPISLISRDNEISEITNSFISENPDSQVYILNGSRGSGKTVSLTTISNEFKTKKNWLVIDINPSYDILNQLASKIYDEGRLAKLFLKAEFSFSCKAIGLTVSGGSPVTNVSTFLKTQLDYLKKKNINLLITIDEISSNDYVETFVHEFQLFLRNNYNVFLVMTGLYHNISALENKKTLTFLKRAPKIQMDTLNLKAIVNAYKNIFEISETESVQLAKMTNGYPFAYQLLGDLLFKNNSKKLTNEIIDKFDEIIQERAYSLIFNELSPKEQEILKSSVKDNSNQAIMKDINMKKNQLSNYKLTLFKKGILDSSNREKINIKLPRFKEYIQFLISLD